MNKAASEATGQGFRDFLASRVEPIPGWLNVEAALLTARLAHAQRKAELLGPTLEIGVFKGKYLSVLYELSQIGELVLGVDLFVGAVFTSAVVEEVRANVAVACGENARLRLLVADSLKLSVDQLLENAGRKEFRFISVDGGHTREVVLNDLELAYSALQPGGIIALDDAFNHTTPGVIEGATEFFFRRKPRLAPFAHCYNKLFLTTPDYHGRYLRETLEFVDEVTWLPTHERTRHRMKENRDVGFTPMMFGYEIIPFL